MDQKHREYCIRLGNPYMKEEQFNNQLRRVEKEDSSWMPETQMPSQEDWLKNKTKNFS